MQSAGIEVVVRSEQPYTEISVDVPRASWHGHAEFRFERPAVVTQVDQPCAVILAGWRRNGDARAKDRLAWRLDEFAQRHRVVAAQVDRQLEARVREAGT